MNCIPASYGKDIIGNIIGQKDIGNLSTSTLVRRNYLHY